MTVIGLHVKMCFGEQEMPRVRLHEQPHYEFSYRIAVQARDLSAARHLGNEAVIQILHEAIVNTLHALTLGEFDLGDGKTGVIEEDTVVDFRSEAFLFDPLHVEAHIDEVDANGFRIFHRITRQGKLVVLAESGLAGFDYARRAIAPIPDAFTAALLQYRQKPEGPPDCGE